MAFKGAILCLFLVSALLSSQVHGKSDDSVPATVKNERAIFTVGVPGARAIFFAPMLLTLLPLLVPLLVVLPLIAPFIAPLVGPVLGPILNPFLYLIGNGSDVRNLIFHFIYRIFAGWTRPAYLDGLSAGNRVPLRNQWGQIYGIFPLLGYPVAWRTFNQWGSPTRLVNQV